ncbi:MAG: 2-oxo acid dehydrogenase subunit E2 [Myxococcales bacterium]|nr:2-oxo acid dehydrogenase subunit E2 [Myxococcales bacterium]
MARLIEMPKLSPTMEEGQIAAWHKKEGDSVDVDDLLAEVETDKATMEFRSFDRGTLLKVLAPAGAIVKLGEPVAIIGKVGDSLAALLAGTADAGPATRPAADFILQLHHGSPAAGAQGPPPTAPPTRIIASPFVRKQARERGLDLRVLVGTGPGGRIVAQDLPTGPPLAIIPETRPVPASDPANATPGREGTRGTLHPVPTMPQARPMQDRLGRRSERSREPTVKPLTMMRKTIARRLTESKRDVPHFYLTIDIDAGAFFELRQRLNQDLAPQKVSFNDLVVKGVAIAIGRAPEVNAQFAGDSMVFHQRVDLSIAVAVDDGLVTPVIRDADTKSLLAISLEIASFAERARARTLRVDEMTGGTFSISNLGMYGIDEFSAVINPPEGAILAVGSVRSEPVIVGDAVVPGKRMKLTLSCDHRVVDGAVGARFLAELRGVLERPLQLLAL